MAWKNVQYQNGKFKTGSGGGGGASALTDLDDVSISSANDGQVLKYDSTSSKWVNANESGGGHNYSTTEQVVGTWIDGKPLYEKTLKIVNNIDFRTGVEIATGISNPEFVKIAEGYFYDSPNDGIGALPYNQGVSSIGDWIYLPVYKQSTNKLVLKTTATFSANNARYLIIVLQYTKTTD